MIDNIILLMPNYWCFLVVAFTSLWTFYDWPLRNISVTNDQGYFSFVVILIRFFSYSWLITGFIPRIARWVPHVELELLPVSEHLSSPPRFLQGFVLLDLCFLCDALLIVVWSLRFLSSFDLQLITHLLSSSCS